MEFTKILSFGGRISAIKIFTAAIFWNNKN
jgi:hypothetical protein